MVVFFIIPILPLIFEMRFSARNKAYQEGYKNFAKRPGWPVKIA